VSEAPGERLARLAGPGEARLLASRLTAEGVGAVASGAEVYVRSQDLARARVLAALFAEVDAGRSSVVPPLRRSLWEGDRRDALAGSLLAAAVAMPLVVVVLLAIAL
jgi:hypothetical protein